jgi:hypothetical protein
VSSETIAKPSDAPDAAILAPPVDELELELELTV